VFARKFASQVLDFAGNRFPHYGVVPGVSVNQLS
jgi:hypothetical protein